MGLEQYALHLLTFIFGYFTCRTFYFFKTTRISIRLLKVAHVVCLAILTKCIEEYSYAESQKLLALLKCGITKDDELYKSVTLQHEREIELLKKRSIQTILALHPEYFRTVADFSDWDTAMQYLNANKKIAQTFLS